MILESSGNNNHWTGIAGKWNDEYSDIERNPEWPGFYGIAEIPLTPNNSPIGFTKIVGDLKVGQTLTSDISNINDADNFQGWTPSYSYSWKSSSDNKTWIEIGTGSNYKSQIQRKARE